MAIYILKIDEDKKIIYDIRLGTTYTELFENISTSGTIEIYTKDGEELKESSITKTNSIIKIKLSSKTYEYTISVLGDTTGDGYVKLGDISKLYSYFPLALKYSASNSP